VPRVAPPQESRTVDWRNGQTIPFSAGLGTDLRFDRTFSQTSVKLDIDRLERLCSRWLGRPLDRPLRFALQPFSPQLQQIWDRLLAFLHAVSEDQFLLGPVVAASLDEFILTTVLQGHPHSLSDDLAAPVAAVVPGIVRRADRHMAENAAAPLTIADIAIEVANSGWQQLRAAMPMRDSEIFQYQLGRVSAEHRAARAARMVQAEGHWRHALAGTLRDEALLAEGTQTGIWVATTCARVADACFTLAGGSAVYDSSQLQRHMRDLHAATQHAIVHQRNYVAAGKTVIAAFDRQPEEFRRRIA
jgi:hypothetical protein